MSVEVPPIDSRATLERTERIAASLTRWGITNHVLRNSWDEPLAVLVEDGAQASELGEIAAAAEIPDYIPKCGQAEKVQTVWPADLHSGLAYSPKLTDIMDATVQGASGQRDVLACQLGSRASGSYIGDAWPHIDFPGALDNYRRGLLQGVNVHVTLNGEGAVRFGHIRSWQQVRNIGDFVLDALKEDTPPLAIDVMIAYNIYKQASYNLTPYASLIAGDVLIWQAATQWPDHLPVIHDFASLNDKRSYAVFTPQAGPLDTVNERREALALPLQEA